MSGQLLIVEKTNIDDERMQGLLSELGACHQLDAFTARQRLWGNGLSLFARGVDQRLNEIADLLARHGVTHWLLKPTPPGFTPEKISALTVTSEIVTFICPRRQVVLARGDIVLAVLADLSGAAAEKRLKKLLVHQAYRGTTIDANFSAEELQLEILRSRPVLDIYLLTPEYSVRNAVRIFPGRFNPAGLGERAGYSAAGNLQAIMELTKSYAGEWHLHTDFGLSGLPGYQPVKGEAATLLDRKNLASLTRFGWLMADLLAHSSLRRAMEDASQQRTLTGGGLLMLQSELPGEPEKGQTERTAVQAALPPPPEAEITGGGLGRWKNRKYLFLVPVVFFSLALGMQQPALRTAAFRYAIDHGVLPALLSLALVWRGFLALHLKRRIENTPTSKVRSLAMGLVELHGRAERFYALVSPMSHMPCIWYRISKFRIEENGTRQPLGSSDSGPLPFFLDDGSGRVVVTPKGAKFCAQTRHEGSPSGGLLFATASISSDEHWVEEIIPEGTWIYVLGFARPRQQTRASLKERLIHRLRHLKSSPDKLKRFDYDGNGRICDGEWSAARREVEQELLEESLSDGQDSRLGAEKAEIGRPPQRGLPFIIAEAASELHVAGRFGLNASLSIAGAVGFGVWAIITWLE